MIANFFDDYKACPTDVMYIDEGFTCVTFKFLFLTEDLSEETVAIYSEQMANKINNGELYEVVKAKYPETYIYGLGNLGAGTFDDETIDATAATTATPDQPELMTTAAPDSEMEEIAAPGEPGWNLQGHGQMIGGNANSDAFGFSIALSADATTLMVGAPGYNNRTGYVAVYRKDEAYTETIFMVREKTIYGKLVDDNFGHSVDINSEGHTLAVGSPGYNTDRLGYVRVFYMESSTDLGYSWSPLGQDVTGETDDSVFGVSVSLSDDGKNLAVGASYNIGNGVFSGYVRVYNLDEDGTSWKKIGNDIGGNATFNWPWPQSLQLMSVSLSANGTIVAVGSPWTNDNGDFSGHVTVYQFDSELSSWEQVGQRIHGNATGDLFGYSLKISPDASTLAIGSPVYWGWGGRPGYAQVYNLDSSDNVASNWKQLGGDLVGEADGDMFGWSVSLSDFGKTVAIGGVWNDVKKGHVQVYRMDDSGMRWTQLGEDIVGENSDDRAGESISLSADGNTVAVSSMLNDLNWNDSGVVRVFAME